MKISIVTPCYNSEKTIERTINSVITQIMNDDIEYIIIDGQSSDSTLNIIKKYAEKYPTIKFISEKDNSMTEALNKGMKLATGDIVASINADDFYLPGSLQKVVDEFIKNRDIDVLIGNNLFLDNDLHAKSINKPRKFSPIRCAFMECPFPECNIFFKRNVIEALGYFNESLKYTQDFELYLRLYNAGYKFFYRDIDLSCFVMTGENYSSNLAKEMRQEVMSYFKYKTIFRIFAHSTASKLLKIIFRVRHYFIIKRPYYKEAVRR